jgi:hypothetical protein
MALARATALRLVQRSDCQDCIHPFGWNVVVEPQILVIRVVRLDASLTPISHLRGNTLAYLTLLRGSAIISTTVSRQV